MFVTSRRGKLHPIKFEIESEVTNQRGWGGGRAVWQRVAMHSLKFHQGPPCPTLLCPKRVGPTTGWAACSRLLPAWTPHAIRLWWGERVWSRVATRTINQKKLFYQTRPSKVFHPEFESRGSAFFHLS
jgi:hypothetical protein